MVTQTENQLPIYSSIPANLGAVTCTTLATQYVVGFSNGPGSTTLSAATAIGASTITVASASSFYQGECVLIEGGSSTAELAIVTNITSTTFTVQRFDGNPLLQQPHASGGTVVGTSAAMMPTYSGRVTVSAQGTLTGNTSTDGVTGQLVVINATKAAGPTAGTALGAITAGAATAVGNTQALTLLTGVLTQAFGVGAALGQVAATNTSPSGGAALSVGVPYVFDLLVADTSVAGHTVQAKSVIWQIEEV